MGPLRHAIICLLMLNNSLAYRFGLRQLFPARCTRVQSSLTEDDDSDGYTEVLSIQEEIRSIVDVFKTADGGMGTVDPTILTENAHILTKGRYYEIVMEDIVRDCVTSKEVAKIEAIDSFIRGFIVSERKQRSRLKLNYIMAGASSNRLDESIKMLSDRYRITPFPYQQKISTINYQPHPRKLTQTFLTNTSFLDPHSHPFPLLLS